MLVKTFQAEEMSEALKMVKAEMGQDAMILSSKKEQRKGIRGLFSKPYYEVTAALDPRPPVRANPYKEKEERELSTKDEFQNSMLLPLARELRELKERVEAMSRRDVAATATFVDQSARSPEVREQAPSVGREQLDEIRAMLLNAVAAKDKQEPRLVQFPQLSGDEKPVKILAERASVTKGEFELLADELRSNDVGEEGVTALLEAIRPAAEDGADLYELREHLAEAFAGVIKCAGPLRLKKNTPRVVAIVGPTGVGKTTTIAKLAAQYALTKGAKVALVTTDNFRVGAIEQLKTYAKIMDLTLDVAGTSKDLGKVLAMHADKDLVLIDTAGRSHKDREKLEELKLFLEDHTTVETYLCIAATTREREMNETIENFGILPVSRLLFTKLDESGSFGSLVNVHLRHRYPFSYLTNGQRVPEDIEVATGRKLASLILKDSVL
jgi:flagellar biosynthesis protein FlhF